MQVDSIKPTLTAHGTTRSKLKYDILLTNFGFKFNMRRYCEDVKSSLGRVEVGVQELIGGAGSNIQLSAVSFFRTPASPFLFGSH